MHKTIRNVSDARKAKKFKTFRTSIKVMGKHIKLLLSLQKTNFSYVSNLHKLTETGNTTPFCNSRTYNTFNVLCDVSKLTEI